MLRVIVFAFFMLVSFNLTAAPAVSFIEFTPIAAISDGYSFGISEIKVNKRTIYTVSFKKGKDVFAVTPENMLRGYYPDLTFTGLAINKNTIVIGGKERYSSNEPWIFMFKIQDKKISIADIITKATVNEYKYNFEYNLPSIDAPRSLPDVDKDKKPEIELDFYETGITLYAEIKELFLKENIYISPRIDKAVLSYCKTAASLFEEEYGISTDIIGLDYAVSQKLLPKINGNGEMYRKWLNDELFCKLEKHNMLKSKFKVAAILDCGERRMNYFQYFD